MTSRIEKLQNYLSENALDAFLVLTKLNRQYVSGFTGSMGAVLISRKNAGLFVDGRYTIRAKRESPLKTYSLSTLSLRKDSKLGIEDNIVLKEFKRLKQNYKGVQFVTTSNVIEDLRAVKSTKEIKYIKKAQSIIDKIFFAVRKMRLTGMTELELSQKMERLAIKFGADGMAFESIVAFGPNAAAPHHLSGKQKIKRGNFLLLDFGVLVKGYHSDFTRTLFIGKSTIKQEKVYRAVLDAQIRAIEKITSPSLAPSRGGEEPVPHSPPRQGELEGVRASLIDKTARDYIASMGFGKYFTHNTGHGVGLEIHELPNLSSKSLDILRTGMVVTVEPGIYIENWGGVRIEDMVLVSGDNPVVLSKSPKDFGSMIIK